MTPDDTTSNPSPKRHGRWLATLLIGMVLGAALASVLPQYGGLGRWLSPTTTLEGEVVDKESRSDRLVLKIATSEGLVLASYTEHRSDVDLLVDRGSQIRIEAERNQPFLDNPTILSVHGPRSEPAGPTSESTREAYQRAMEEQLRRWEKKLSELDAATKKAKDDLARKYQPEIEKLQQMRDATREKLDELEAASGSAWKDLKGGLDNAWTELDQALEKAETRFRRDETESPAKQDNPEPPDHDPPGR